MAPMTATFPELIIQAALNDPGLHSLSEVVAVICLVAILLEREMVRHRRGLSSRAVVPSLTALAAPLAIGWAFIAVERFIELAGG
jgi:hypothetical protein